MRRHVLPGLVVLPLFLVTCGGDPAPVAAPSAASASPEAVPTQAAAAPSTPPPAATSPAAPPAREDSRTKTVGGDLVVIERKPMASYEVRLGDKVVVTSDQADPKNAYANAPLPAVVKSLGPVAPFDEVVLLKWPGATGAAACGVFVYSFVGVKKDGTFDVQDAATCTYGDPTITVKGSKVTLAFVKAKSNTGAPVPAATWVYEKGKVSKTK